jgi:hypothetical protein
MRSRVTLSFLLMGAMVALTTLAYIEPPDPVWLGGFYDEDADDVLVYVQSHLNAVEAPILAAAAVSVPSRHAPLELYECVAPGSIPSARHPRAPPSL